MIVTTDLHLTDRDRDSYRWDIFPWLQELCESAEPLLILGDLTDAKDGHSAQLVDRIVNALADFGNAVYILKGNHDYRDPATPFFGFLDRIPGVRFISEPEIIRVGENEVLFLPHERQPIEAWDKLNWDTELDLIVCHQTFDGAQAANGHKLQGGIGRRYFTGKGHKDTLVLAGDIHVPQDLGDVTYVGTPYPVAFGDAHTPRVIIVREEQRRGQGTIVLSEKKPPTIQKQSLVVASGAGDFEFQHTNPGDQLKLRVQLDREDFCNWEEIRTAVLAAAEARGAYVHSIELEARPNIERRVRGKRTTVTTKESPQDVLSAFCRSHGLTGGERDAAQDILDRIQ